MYKRCITDTREQEPKKLFYLIQFLMYDKDKKGFINEEDTLEILYIRYQEKFGQAVDDIFIKETAVEKGKEKVKVINPPKHEKLTFLEYVEKMHKLSLLKRRDIVEHRKHYCSYIKDNIEKGNSKK